jgi:hypothetical protein
LVPISDINLEYLTSFLTPRVWFLVLFCSFAFGSALPSTISTRHQRQSLSVLFLSRYSAALEIARRFLVTFSPVLWPLWRQPALIKNPIRVAIGYCMLYWENEKERRKLLSFHMIS